VESNERYYRRRAVEERMAAQRAVTETARAWHSQLAESFAERAIACTSTSTSIGIGIGIAASSAVVAVSG